MARRRTITVGVVVAAGLLVAVLLAVAVSPFASSSPDGLERVAADKGFLDTATDSAVAGGPLADYRTSGVDNDKLSTGLAGLIGVLVTFVVGFGLFLAMRGLGRRNRTPSAPAVAPAPGGSAVP
jgi:cobalt/nickel transport system permease protein/cobalt/nickel transport protein